MSEKGPVSQEEVFPLTEEYAPSVVREELVRILEIEARWVEMQEWNKKLLLKQMDIIGQWVRWEKERVHLFLKEVKERRKGLEGAMRYLRDQLQASNEAVKELLLDKEILLDRMDQLLTAVNDCQPIGITDPVQEKKEET